MLLKTWSRSIIPMLFLLAIPAFAMAEVDISVNIAPPELPVYEQPPIPGEGYIWTPGYWAWGDDIQDYYWVPGTWVEAPQPEYLWTPGYWAADGAIFFWRPGYWGPHVGFYGGVNYGYGYGGEGYEGGYWRGGRMYYNRSVNNINNTNITNVYNRTVVNNVNETRVSYNGGNGGVRARPSATEQAAAHERHIDVTPTQIQHVQAARSNPVLRAGENNGRPPIAATPRPAAFTGAGVIPATRGGAVSGRGTMSVVHNPDARAPQPENRPVQPQNRAAQPENRPAQPQNRAPQPEYRQAQPQSQPQSQPQGRPVQPEYRPAPPPPREARPAPEAPRQPPPPMEQRRAPEQAPPPRQSAPPPPPPRQSAPPPRAEPRPAERPPAREQDREHH